MTNGVRRLGNFARDLIGESPARGGLALALAAMGAAAEGVGLMLLVPIIGLLTGSDGPTFPGGRALIESLPEGQTTRLVLLIAAVGALMLLRGVVTVARDVHFARLNSDFITRTRSEVLGRLVGNGWSHIAGLRHGRIAHLVSADFQACGMAGVSFINLCLSGIMLVTLMLVALILAPPVASAIAILVVLLAAILLPSLTRTHRAGGGLAEVSVRLTSDLGQLLAGLKQTLGNNLGRAFLNHIEALQRMQAHYMVGFARQQSRSRATIALVGGAVAAVALLTGWGVLGMSAPKLLAALVVLARVGGPSIQFQQSLQQLLHSLPTYEKIKALEAELGPVAPPAPTAVAFPQGPMVLTGVRYLHAGGGERGGLESLDLAFGEGDRVAIVGPSGAGKTTLADLLAGLIEPQHGAITIGGTTLTRANAVQWQSVIAYVPQDPFLLNDTIRANLTWGSRDTSEDALNVALNAAAATAFVEARELGLDTPVGERGILLSGGERQRIALARALLRRPRFVILDEATNALDPETERVVLANFAALPDRPTIVAISHRSAILDLFDRVYRIEQGRLV